MLPHAISPLCFFSPSVRLTATRKYTGRGGIKVCREKKPVLSCRPRRPENKGNNIPPYFSSLYAPVALDVGGGPNEIELCSAYDVYTRATDTSFLSPSRSQGESATGKEKEEGGGGGGIFLPLFFFLSLSLYSCRRRCLLRLWRSRRDRPTDHSGKKRPPPPPLSSSFPSSFLPLTKPRR